MMEEEGLDGYCSERVILVRDNVRWKDDEIPKVNYDDEPTLNEMESKATMMMMVSEAVSAQLMYQHNCKRSYHNHA